jgi:hypothetical protein
MGPVHDHHISTGENEHKIPLMTAQYITSCKFFGDGTGQSVRMHARVELCQRQAGKYPGGLTMARIRITLEDDDGRTINGDQERVYDLPVGAKRLVDIEAAVEGFKQAALPELTAELLTLAQHQFVAEVKKGVS